MFTNFAIFDLGTPELVLILAVVLLLFGGKKLPELSRSLGQSIRELKGAANGANDFKQEVAAETSATREALTGSPARGRRRD